MKLTPVDKTHLDAVRGLILLSGFHFKYLLIPGWLQEGNPVVKTASNTNKFMLYQSKDNILNTQKPGHGDRPVDYTRNRKRQYVKLRIDTLNAGAITERSEIVEMLSLRNVDICCVQETRWKGESARKVMGKNCHYQFFWKGDESGHSGVGILNQSYQYLELTFVLYAENANWKDVGQCHMCLCPTGRT